MLILIFDMLVDTHAHINFAAFKKDADEAIKRALEKQVFLINVGSQYSTSKRAIEMANRYEIGVWATVGLHPIHLLSPSSHPQTGRGTKGEGLIKYKDSDELDEIEIKTNGENFDYQKYLELAKNPKVVAIGEVGLDYKHFEKDDDILNLIKKQKEILVEFIKVANEVEKPIIIHCWGNYSETKAYDDLLEILRNHPVKKAGIIHSFMGNHKTAKKFTELGYKIGLNGVITYSDSFNRLIKELDLKDIVLETDCPYLTPVPHKGERNEPLYVKLVAEKIAQIKEISVEKVAEITTQNANKTFIL